LEITRILLAEDNADHASLIIDELETENVKREIVLMKDGQEIVDYFQKMNIDGSSGIHPQIDLVLLDLNLPKVPGIEVLRFLKNDSKLCVIPVIILSTSSDQKMIDEAYKNGANGYLIKPSSYEEFTTKMRCVKKYWLDTNLLPS
jgi:CheY-like chemotaxis protein